MRPECGEVVLPWAVSKLSEAGGPRKGLLSPSMHDDPLNAQFACRWSDASFFPVDKLREVEDSEAFLN
jgi:hypothetical protein